MAVEDSDDDDDAVVLHHNVRFSCYSLLRNSIHSNFFQLASMIMSPQPWYVELLWYLGPFWWVDYGAEKKPKSLQKMFWRSIGISGVTITCCVLWREERLGRIPQHYRPRTPTLY